MNKISPREMPYSEQLIAHLRVTDNHLYRIVTGKINSRKERGTPYNPVVLEAFAKVTLSELDKPMLTDAERRELKALRQKHKK